MKPLEAIRCTDPTCPCECFAPGKQSLRYCDTCNHGWVAHALDKLGTNHVMNLGLQVEVVQPNIVFDIASLMLYGAQATPVRLKILLDRLFSVLQHEEVLQVLHGFGWTYEDYARGYILQDSAGRVLDKWCVATREEELVVLQQFLRFGETKAIAQEIILQDTKDRHEVLVKQAPSAESDIKKFIERSNLSMQNYIKSYESTRQLFGTRPVPFISSSSRIISTPVISSNYTSSREPRGLSLPQTPAISSISLATPLNRFQVLQPFDARKDLSSPAISLSPVALDKPIARRSPLCDSPKNLTANSTSISPTSAPPTHQILLPPQQPQQQQPQQQCLDEVDGIDTYLSGSEDDDSEALDYSNKDNPGSLSDGDKKNKLHMRKSNNPVKRQWTPSANFGSTFVGPNGKKRVLCTACNKTFCDKGALKIHYSAVHLKEMHKCTVDGCHMMFSSRRSRNRHSANPNPKLHMPQKRKDEMDQSEEIDLSISNGSTTPNNSGTPLTTIPDQTIAPTISTQIVPIIDSQHIIRPNSSFFIEMSSQFPFMTPPEKRIKIEEQPAELIREEPTEMSRELSSIISKEQPTEMSKVQAATSIEEEPCDLSRKYDEELKLQIDLDASSNEMEVSNEMVTATEIENVKKEEEIEADDAGKINDGSLKGGNRRKNTAPIKCAQNEPTKLDNSNELDIKGKIPFLLNRDGVLAISGESSFMSSKNGLVCFKGKIEENKKIYVVEQSDQEERSTDFQDATNSQTQVEKRLIGNEARNFPKIASLLWAGGMIIANTQDNVKEKDATNKSDDDFRGDETINQETAENDEDLSSESDILEEIDSLPSSESLIDCPPDEYVDNGNPLKCRICGKVFQNSFTVKIHFQNVHLKVMHPCTVDGCSSTFPSKRSRDRHSANINLHRRILVGDSNVSKEVDDTLRGDILAKLYGHDLISTSVISNAEPNQTVIEDSTNNNNNNNEEIKGQEERTFHALSNGKVKNVPGNNSLKITIQHGVHGHVSKPGSTGSEAISDESDGENEGMSRDVYLENQSLKVPCKVCGDKFSNHAVLQEHISISHPEHALSPSDPALKKMVSPRRARSRQKTRNATAARKQ